MANKCLDFGAALSCLRGGGRAYRTGWSDTRDRIALHYPEVGGVMSRPFVFLETADGSRSPWGPSQDDMFAVDWVVEPRE